MRISDWSSDVGSSDLSAGSLTQRVSRRLGGLRTRRADFSPFGGRALDASAEGGEHRLGQLGAADEQVGQPRVGLVAAPRRTVESADGQAGGARQTRVWGKGVSVSLDSGGRQEQ